MSIDVVCKGVHILSIAVCVLHCNFDYHIVSLPFEIDWFVMERLFFLVQVLNEFYYSAVISESISLPIGGS